MKAKIPERYAWAISILDVRPEDEILEVGCGYGHAVSLICSQLSKGHLTCIDRSVKMTDAAARSNREYLSSGKCTVINDELLNVRLPEKSFDKVFLFNINVFWMDPAAELSAVKGLLKPNGRFYIFHQPPPGMAANEYADRFRINLLQNGFDVEKILLHRIEDSELTAVIARAA